MTHLSLCPYNLIVLYSDERSEGEYKKNSLTSGKPWLENGELIYINLSFLF
jgi:hypothetical protein